VSDAWKESMAHALRAKGRGQSVKAVLAGSRSKRDVAVLVRAEGFGAGFVDVYAAGVEASDREFDRSPSRLWLGRTPVLEGGAVHTTVDYREGAPLRLVGKDFDGRRRQLTIFGKAR
jgi:hypothetical protein